MTETPRTVGPPDTGVLGVGCGADAKAQLQLILSTQDAFRQTPLIHASPATQSVFTEQAILHEDTSFGVGVGVGVLVGKGVGVAVGTGVLVGLGVGVGVLVGAGVGVGVGVNVGVGVVFPIWKLSVHAGAEASGSAWGTVGAITCVLASCWLVKYTTTPSPSVKRETRIRYQYCFMNFIVNANWFRCTIGLRC